MSTRSYVESEMSSADDKIAKITWTKKLRDYQGWGIERNVGVC